MHRGIWASGIIMLAVTLTAARAMASSYAYILNDTSNTISVIDTATNTVVATPDIGTTSLHGSVVLPNGNFAYLGAYGANRVTVIDTLTQTVAATINGFNQPRAMAALPDSSRVYVGNNSANRIDVIDTATNTITAQIPTPAATAVALAASPDGSRVYVVLDSNLVRFVDTATNTLSGQSVSAGASATGIVVSPDGNTIYVASSGNALVRVFDTTLTQTRTITAANNPYAVALSPDGTILYVAAIGNDTLRVINAATGASIANVPTTPQPAGVALNPEGTRAYVTTVSGNSVNVIDTATNTVITTISAPRPSGIGKFVSPELSRLTIDAGGGTVTAGTTAGPQLTCTGTDSCQRNYATAATVTLTATPSAGANFTRWTGDCTGISPTVSFVMGAARNCVANFMSPPPPPPIPPSWFNPVAMPSISDVPVSSLGGFTVSLGSVFTAPLTSLTASVTDVLKSFFSFITDPVNKTVSGTVNALPGQPTQPIATPDAANATPNAIYPAMATIVAPVTINATDTQGANFGITVNMNFRAPRQPAAMAALSATSDGSAAGNGASGTPALSHDGGQIAFTSAATNLVPAARPVGTDVLRYRALSGSLDRLSQSAFPGAGPSGGALGPATDPAVSSDGRHAAFTASGQGLVVGLNTNGVRQVYRIGLKYPRIDLDPATPTAELVSGTAAGLAGNGHSDGAVLSADGRYVAFASTATNLGPDLDGTSRIWRKDMATGALIPVSAAGATDAAMTADGRFVAYAAGGQIQLKDLGNGAVWTVAQGSRPRLSADGSAIVFVASGTIVVVRGGTTTAVGAGDQPSVSADGRFVAWRSPEGQIQVRDTFRGVSALVSRTATGTGGNGPSSDPAISGDGRSIAFATQARDLVTGNIPAGQLMLAGNPLVDPAGSRYWYVTSGDQQSLAIERRGTTAYVASLTYDAAGNATWVAGFCRFAGLTCTGQFSHVTGGGTIADPRAAASPGAPFAIAFTDSGTDATLTLNQATLGLKAFPLGGNTYPAMPGLPEAGWWYNTDDPSGATGWFLATATPMTGGTTGTPVAMLTGTVYDRSGQPFWAVAQGTIAGTTSFSFNATLNRYAGGAPLGQAATQSPSGSPVGPIAITWTGPRTATAVMPDGQRANLARWPF